MRTALPYGNWALVCHEAMVVDIFKNVPGEHVPNSCKLNHETIEPSEGAPWNKMQFLRSKNRYPCIETSVRQTLGEKRRGIMFATVFIVRNDIILRNGPFVVVKRLVVLRGIVCSVVDKLCGLRGYSRDRRCCGISGKPPGPHTIQETAPIEQNVFVRTEIHSLLATGN